MKKIIAILFLAAALPALAQNDLTPVSAKAIPGGVEVGIDALAIGEKVADAQWTGFHPALWWSKNVQPVKFVEKNWKGIALAAAVAGAYAIYENNNDSGGSSSRAKAEESPAPSILQSGGGDVYVIAASGDNSTVVISQTTSTIGAAPAETVAE